MHGLTLIELLVGLALTAMLLVPMVAMLRVSGAASAASAEQLDLQEQLQFAMRRMVRRIETTPAALLAAKGSDSSSDTWLAPALFKVQTDPVTGAQSLTETIGGVSTVLAAPVTGFAMTAAQVTAGRTVVNVSLTLDNGNSSASAAASVRLGGLL